MVVIITALVTTAKTLRCAVITGRCGYLPLCRYAVVANAANTSFSVNQSQSSLVYTRQ